MRDYFPFDKDFQALPNCTHLEALKAGNQVDGLALPQRGELALVAIGNPIVENDASALEILKLFRRNIQSDQVCCISLEMSFGWLSHILKSHKSVIILDPIIVDERHTDDFVIVKLEADVISHSGFPIKLSHGLSWLDEVKLVMVEKALPERLLFFGITNPTSSVYNRSQAFEKHLSALAKLVDQSLLEPEKTNA